MNEDKQTTNKMTTKRRFKFNNSGGRGGGGSSSSTSNGGGGGDHDDFFQRNNTKIVLNRRQYAWAFFLSCCVIVTFLNWPLFSTTNNNGKVRGIIQSKPTTVRNMGIFPRVATISEMSWVSVRRNTLFHDVLLLDVAAADNLEMLESHNKKHKDIAVYGSSTFLRNVYSETECTWDEWQVAYHPSCNDAHVIPMDRLFVAATGSKEEEGPKLTNLKRGGMRMGGTLTVDDNFSVLYKTQRIMKSLDFDQELPTFLFRAHKEAIIADVYTGATTKTFGHCGLYSLGEFGKGLSALKSRKKLNPVQKLSYAMQLAQSVTLLHNFDPLLPTIYKDFDPSNVVIVDDRALLVDFDQAEFSLKKNGKTCYPDVSLKRNPYYDVVPLELIPSSKQNETALLTEKTDVYGLGSLFFYILTDGARLYHCEKPTMGVCNYYFKKNNTISENEIITLKQNGAQPSLPKAVEDDDDPAISAIRESMKMALQKNPSERPAPKEILETLVKTCNNIGIGGCRSTSTSSTECKIRIAIRQKVTEPVYVTSYPGSGSELTLNLIEAFTGTKTINHGGRCCDLPERPYDYVALKTHYPWCCENNFTHGQLSNAIVLIRNPMSALPSKANRDYETDVGIRTHSKQCPESYWLKWRAKKFVKHLQLWEQLIYYWFETYSSSNRIILSYESLVDKDSGADVWRGVENFVVRTGAMKGLSSGDTDCLWQTVVAGDKSGRKSEVHRLKSYKPSYTMEQHQLILDTLDRLLTKYRDESFGPDLALYKHKIRTLLQDVTNTTGGTNYGHERIYSGGKHSFDSVAVPILPGATNGPFVINTDLSLPPSDGFVLVKTHCGVNGCFDCSVPSPQNFLDSCASGTSTNKGVKYGVNVVQRAVHLYLNPLANVLTRFNGNSKKYPHTREGFLRWCDDYDDMYSSLKNGIPREILQSNVPCHAEFYKYINWHNNAISAIGILGLPLHTMYAEDFSVSSHNGAIHQLLTFLNLTQVMNGHSFETTNDTVFFNTTQVKQIASFFKQHASDELLRQLSSR